MKRSGVLLACCVLLVLSTTSPVNAAASAGASASCELTGPYCVTGAGQSENAGTSTTGGYATAVCHGGSNGAILMEVKCSIGESEATTALPGPAGAAVLVAPTETLLRQPVCWYVIGYFAKPLGGVEEVETSGCSVVSL